MDRTVLSEGTKAFPRVWTKFVVLLIQLEAYVPLFPFVTYFPTSMKDDPHLSIMEVAECKGDS